ncbi:hypothetical protein BH10PSE17_BH10PSE17_15100 [soil metagenome]
MLDLVFSSLADPTRRAILARLQLEDGLMVSELAAPFGMSMPAVIKHIDVLASAGLLVRERVGRNVRCHIERAPLQAANEWLERHVTFWAPRIDRLVDRVEALELELQRTSRQRGKT